MKILVCEHDVGEAEIEKLLDENQIVIIEDKCGSPEKPMSDVIIRNQNITFAFHYLLKENKEYYLSANVQKENGNWALHVPMSTTKIVELLENTIEYRYEQ